VSSWSGSAALGALTRTHGSAPARPGELALDEDQRLEAARRGDASAFEAIYRALTPRLTRYAGGLVGQDADDVVAEAWLQIIRDLARFDGDWDAFRGWTTRIVRNRAIDHLRAAGRRNAHTQQLDATIDQPGPATTDGAVEEAMSTAAAMELVATLPRDQAEAVLLRAVVGLDAASAGAVLGKRPGTVRVAAHRGLKALARRLESGAAHRSPQAEPTPGGRP
jgi:RNA polymerase sigma-70 factor (ECF subfamily)